MTIEYVNGNKTDLTCPPDAISDELVIRQVYAGKTNAFEIIMRRYNQRLYRIARCMLNDNDSAEDAVQQAYIAAYFRLDLYTPGTSFGAWLTRITINEVLMIKRKPDYRKVDTSESINEKSVDFAHNPDHLHANRELATIIEAAIEKLPEDFRQVFVLRAVQQLSISETAECLNVNETTIKTRLHRARRLMQHNLNQHIEQAGLDVYEFAGQRCDRLVRKVFEKLNPHTNASN